MKYTMSNDNVERTSVRITLRFTREGIAQIKEHAKRDGDKSWRDWISSHAALCVVEQLIEDDGSMEQRYGRGGD